MGSEIENAEIKFKRSKIVNYNTLKFSFYKKKESNGLAGQLY